MWPQVCYLADQPVELRFAVKIAFQFNQNPLGADEAIPFNGDVSSCAEMPVLTFDTSTRRVRPKVCRKRIPIIPFSRKILRLPFADYTTQVGEKAIPSNRYFVYPTHL